MTLSSGKKATLAAVPLVLLALLILLSSRRPHPVMGIGGPAAVSGAPVTVAYAPDGSLLCVAASGTLQKYQPEEKKFRSFTRPASSAISRGTASRMAFSPDGSTVFISYSASTPLVQAFDVKTRSPLYSFIGPGDTAFDVSRDGRWAVCGTSAGLTLLDLKKPLSTTSSASKPAHIPKDRHYYARKIYGMAAMATTAAFSPDSSTLAVGFNGQIALFDVNGDFKAPRLQCDMTGTPVAPQPMMRSSVTMGAVRDPLWIEWSRDGSRLAVLANGEIAIFDGKLKKLATTASQQSSFPGNGIIGGTNSAGANLVWSHDGKAIFSGGDNVRRWSTELRLQASYGVSGPVAISPDGSTLVTTGNGGRYPYLLQWKIG